MPRRRIQTHIVRQVALTQDESQAIVDQRAVPATIDVERPFTRGPIPAHMPSYYVEIMVTAGKFRNRENRYMVATNAFRDANPPATFITQGIAPHHNFARHRLLTINDWLQEAGDGFDIVAIDAPSIDAVRWHFPENWGRDILGEIFIAGDVVSYGEILGVVSEVTKGRYGDGKRVRLKHVNGLPVHTTAIGELLLRLGDDQTDNPTFANALPMGSECWFGLPDHHAYIPLKCNVVDMYGRYRKLEVDPRVLAWLIVEDITWDDEFWADVSMLSHEMPAFEIKVDASVHHPVYGSGQVVETRQRPDGVPYVSKVKFVNYKEVKQLGIRQAAELVPLT